MVSPQSLRGLTKNIMLRPFQRLLYCSRKSKEAHDILIAASGPCLYAFDLFSGALASVWPVGYNQSEAKRPFNATQELSVEGSEDKTISQNAEPLAKRSRTALKPERSESSSTEIILENLNSQKLGLNQLQVPRSTIIDLIGSSRGQNVIAATEDKCIRVFELSTGGVLTQLSYRRA